MLHGGSQALHSGGDSHTLAVAAVDDAGLVHVHADDLAADLGSSLSRGGVDAAAAGEHDFHTQGLIPVVHVSGDVGVAGEGVAVDILHSGGGAQIGSRGVSALNEAIAIADHSGDGHAAQEAQVGVAHLHSSVAGHVAAQLFLIHSAVHVGGQHIGIRGGITVGVEGIEIQLAHVQRHEGHVGIGLGGLLDGVSESIAGHDDDIVALVHSGLDHGHALGGGVTGGLEVVERDTVGLAVGLAGLIGGLVERLVGNVTVVGDHGDAHISGALSGSLFALGRSLLRAAAGNQGQGHHQCKRQSKKLLHWNLPSFKLFDLSPWERSVLLGQPYYIILYMNFN